MNIATATRGLIDTSVLIQYREGEPDALRFIVDILQAGRQPEFSRFSAMALLAWCPSPPDRVSLDLFLRTADIHPVTAKIIRRAQAILESLTPPSPLTADDAIVAATAIEHKLPLYALDPARFAGVAGLTALQPY